MSSNGNGDDALVGQMAKEFIHDWVKMVKAMADQLETMFDDGASIHHLALQVGCITSACFNLVQPGGEPVLAMHEAAVELCNAAMRERQDWAEASWVGEDGVQTVMVLAGGDLGRSLDDGGE